MGKVRASVGWFLTHPWWVGIAGIATVVALVLAVVLAATNTPTLMTPTEAPTLTPTSASTDTHTPTTTNTPTATTIVTLTDGLTIERGHSAIAICSDQLRELEEIRIGSVETYGQEDIISFISTTESSNCVCLQQRDKQFTVPSVCNDENTYMLEPNSNWRGEPISVIFQNTQLRCEAQPFAPTYICDLKNE
jgi:hypothetical protein